MKDSDFNFSVLQGIYFRRNKLYITHVIIPQVHTVTLLISKLN